MNVTLIHPNTRPFVSLPYGWADMLYNDEAANISMSRVFIKGMKSTDMHRHSVKEEVIFCDSGQIIVEYLSSMPTSALEFSTSVRRQVLTPDVGLCIPPGVWHRLSAMEDAYLYVVSTYASGVDIESMPGYAELANSAMPYVEHPDGDPDV